MHSATHVEARGGSTTAKATMTQTCRVAAFLLGCIGFSAATAATGNAWKIRGGHVGLSNDFTMLDAMAEHGMNTALVSVAVFMPCSAMNSFLTPG